MLTMPSLEQRLAARILSLLSQGLRLDAACGRTLEQVLGTSDASALERLLEHDEDAEAASLRDLVLAPDMEFAVALEQWCAGQETDVAGIQPDINILAEALAGAQVRLVLPDGQAMNLCMRLGDAQRFVGCLRVDHGVPREILSLLRDNCGLPEAGDVLEMRVLCKRARLAWTNPQRGFVEQMLQRCFKAAPDDPLRRRALPLLTWCLEFLGHAGDDLAAALSRRREALLKQAELAVEVDRIRERHNYETRRMLGMVEPCLNLAAVHDELVLVDLAIQAAGLPSRAQATVENLGGVCSMDAMISILDR